MNDKKKDENFPLLKKKIFFFKKCHNPKQFQEKKQIKFLCKKTQYFKVENFEDLNKNKGISNEGRWNEEEHEKFLDGIELFGPIWKKVKTLIKTRTSVQVRSHAQKFFLKMKTCKDETLGIDFTLDSIKSIKDMIDQIKSVRTNYDLKTIFKYLNYLSDLNKKPKKLNEEKNNNINNNNSYNDITILINEEDKKSDINNLIKNKLNNEYTNDSFINQNNKKNTKENFYGKNLNSYINNNFCINSTNNNLLINNSLFSNNVNTFYMYPSVNIPLNIISLQQFINNLSNQSLNNPLNNSINNQNILNNILLANNAVNPFTQNPFCIYNLLERIFSTNI